MQHRVIQEATQKDFKSHANLVVMNCGKLGHKLLNFLLSYTLRKKWSQNGSTPGAVSWYVTQLHPWHYFGANFKGGAVFVSKKVRNSRFGSRGGAVLAPGVEPFWLAKR